MYRIIQIPVGHKRHTGSQYEESHVFLDMKCIIIFTGPLAKIEAKRFVPVHDMQCRLEQTEKMLAA